MTDPISPLTALVQKIADPGFDLTADVFALREAARAALAAPPTRGRDDAIAQAVKQCIHFGFDGLNKPPEGHWLNEMWDFGRSLAAPGAAQTAEPRPLTDEQIEAAYRSYEWSSVPHPFRGSVGFERGARWAESALAGAAQTVPSLLPDKP